MNPYRTPAEMPVDPPEPRRSFLVRAWTRFKRRTLIQLHGTFKERKLDDHKDLWEMLKKQAIAHRMEKARREYRAAREKDACYVDERGVHWR